MDDPEKVSHSSIPQKTRSPHDGVLNGLRARPSEVAPCYCPPGPVDGTGSTREGQARPLLTMRNGGSRGFGVGPDPNAESIINEVMNSGKGPLDFRSEVELDPLTGTRPRSGQGRRVQLAVDRED